MKINTYGLKMVGLRKASGETKNYGPCSAEYHEIFYNREDGEVWTVYQYSLGRNDYTVYHDPAIVAICTTGQHMTMQEIADAIKLVMDKLEDVE